jgi:hypothetical protein
LFSINTNKAGERQKILTQDDEETTSKNMTNNSATNIIEEPTFIRTNSGEAIPQDLI